MHRAAVLVAALALAACGGDDQDGDESGGESTSAATDLSLVPATPPSTTPAPTVELPEDAPSELVVTEITPGTGREAVEGDTLLVNYVGVRSEDGTEFDSNYGRQPFPVTLGQSQVIAGWQQGLVGTQAGERLQLDIPAELAYGDTPQGTVIQPGDALSFVIDVLVVVPPNDPTEQPDASDLPRGEGPATELAVEDVRAGDGATVDIGMTAFVNVVIARADNGAVLETTWDDPGPASLVLRPTGIFDGLVEGMIGMRVGGRRVITVPFEQAFGAGGEPRIGLPAETDAVVVVDLVAAY